MIEKETPPEIASKAGDQVRIVPMKRSRVIIREYQRLDGGGESLRMWVVVGLVNLLQPWLGSSLDGDAIGELMRQQNLDVEFRLE